MDVTLPDGRVVENVPKGTTKTELIAKIRTADIQREGEARRRVGQQEGVARTALEQGLQGATFGFADEITDAIGAGLASVLTDEDFSSLFQEARTLSERRLRQQIEDNPVTAITANISGALLTGAAGLSTKAGQTLAANIAKSGLKGRAVKGAAAGAVSGVAFGAGTAQEGERIEGAQEGAVTGAVLGAAAPVAIAAAPKVVKTAVKALRGQSADDVLAARLSDKNLTVLRKELAESGGISILPDVAGDEIRGLTKLVVRGGGNPRNTVIDFLEGRSKSAVERVTNLLSRKVSNVDAYFGNLDDLAKARAVAAQPLYAQAYKANKSVSSKEIDRILLTPAGKKALNNAVTKMRNSQSFVGVPDKELTEQAALVANKIKGGKPRGGVAKGLNLRTLDFVKKSLDDEIGKAIRKGTNDQVRILSQLKNKLVREMDEADTTGAYQKARRVFSDFKALEEAQEVGLKFNLMSPEKIRRTVKDFTPGELDAFRVGVRSNVQKTIEATPSGGDPAKRIFGNTLKQNQLRAVFKGDGGFEKFSKRLNEEIAGAETTTAVTGGLPISQVPGGEGRVLGAVTSTAKVAGSTARGTGLATSRAIDAVIGELSKRKVGLSAKNADALAKTLINKEEGLAALDRLITKEAKKPDSPLLDLVKKLR